jgi:hypothetical protein
MKAVVAAVAAFALAIPVAILALVLVVAGNCGVGGSSAGLTVSGSTTVAVQGWKGEQLVNAATIIDTIAGRGLSSAVQVVAVTAAMGESSLVNLNHDDDARNPDGSIADGGGLFQQQVSQGWGTWEQVTDPAYATNTFVDRLLTVSGWESMPVTIAINRVQGNSDPQHYAKFEADAREVVAALTGDTVDASASAQCTAGSGNYPPATGQPPGPWGGFQNGRIDESALTRVPWDTRHRLRADATAALIAMNAQFRAEFGYDLPINDGYRDYPNQVKAELEYGSRAAPAGTSNHGWALAIDIGDRGHTVIGYGHAIYAWLKANAGRYGWVHPDWAEPGGRGPHEAWHWEFYGTTP